MSHPAEQSPQNAEEPAPKTPRSTWVVAGIAVVLLLGAIAGGLAGLGAWLFLVGILLLLTAGYAMMSGRQSWARLRNAKLRKTALAVGAGALVLGGTFIALGAPALPEVAVDETAEVSDTQTPTPSPTPSPSPSASEESIADQACTPEATSRTQGETDFLCTLDNDGKLVWMEKDTSEQLTEARKAAAEQAAAEAAAKAEADRQAAEAEAARLAEQQAEADRQAAAEAQRQAEEAAAAAEAQRQAEEAAAAEAQRLAEEAEAQRLAEEQKQVPNPGVAPYANCDAVRAAGADPIYPGDPGWQPKLDGNDNDGIGCEP